MDRFPNLRSLVEAVHDSPTRLVLALSGGGARAATSLLEVPGASRTVLEATVPYSEAALTGWLGGRPDRFCAESTARSMAVAAWLRARQWVEDEDAPVAGIACTASLASDRPKRGPHRAHVAVQTDAATLSLSLELCKGARSRQQEERLVAGLILNATAEACEVEDRLELDWLEGEHIERTQTIAPPAWRNLLAGRTQRVAHGPRAEQPPEALFPGAFNPLHVGHRRMAALAARRLDVPVAFEISILNADKPPLDYTEMERRLAGFSPGETIWFSRAMTFERKSELFGGVTFIVGADTIRRIAEVRYYGDAAARQAAFDRMASRGCRFLVFGRALGEGFHGLGDLDLPDALSTLCEGVPAEEFREDISSTELRREEEG